MISFFLRLRALSAAALVSCAIQAHADPSFNEGAAQSSPLLPGTSPATTALPIASLPITSLPITSLPNTIPASGDRIAQGNPPWLSVRPVSGQGASGPGEDAADTLAQQRFQEAEQAETAENRGEAGNTPQASSVPEPSAIWMALTGLLLFGICRRPMSANRG